MNRIIFAGTPEIAAGVLQALIEAKFNVVACLTQPDRPQGRGLKLQASAVKTVALQHNITVLQPKSLKSETVQQQLKDLNADIMVVMAYGLILPSAVLSIPRLGCINLHASILPRWRGAAPIQHAILAGDHESGITVMQMDAGLDTGAILTINPCPVKDSDTSAILHDRLAQLAKISCIEALPKLFNGSLQPIAQDDHLATYAHKIDKAQAEIKWDNSAQEIDRCIRAYNPWPISFTTFNKQIVRIWEAHIVQQESSTALPGTILHLSKNGMDIATGNGIIRILKLQFPGKRVLAIADVLNSNKELVAGAHFNYE